MLHNHKEFYVCKISNENDNIDLETRDMTKPRVLVRTLPEQNMRNVSYFQPHKRERHKVDIQLSKGSCENRDSRFSVQSVSMQLRLALNHPMPQRVMVLGTSISGGN